MGNDSILWEEESVQLEMPVPISRPVNIPAKSAAGFRLAKGDILEVIDLEGQQVADLFCFSVDDPSDTLSSGRSIDYEDTILFSTGRTLYSHSGKPMLRILNDTCGRHDFLVTPCSLHMFQMMSGSDDYHHSCQENLELVLREFPVDLRQISTTFNIFMNVTFAPSGHIKVESPLSNPGDSISFMAIIPLYVGLTACSDEGSNGGSCKPIAYRISANRS